MTRPRTTLGVRGCYWKGINSKAVPTCPLAEEPRVSEVTVALDYDVLLGSPFAFARSPDIRPFVPVSFNLFCLDYNLPGFFANAEHGENPVPKLSKHLDSIAG